MADQRVKLGPQVNKFDRLSQAMDKAADKLRDSANAQMREAGRNVGRAGRDSVDAFAYLSASGVNALMATARTAEGVAETVMASGNVAAAGGLAVAGTATLGGEAVRSGGYEAAKNTAKGLVRIYNGIEKFFGFSKMATAREIAGDPTRPRFSERLFGAAAGRLNSAGDNTNAAFVAYGQALGHAIMTGVDLTLAAGNTAAVAADLAAAAALTGSAGATKMAEFTVRLSTIGVEAAEQGTKGAAELVLLAARAEAATANVLAQPDQSKVEIYVHDQIRALQNEIKALARQNKGLQPFADQLTRAA